MSDPLDTLPVVGMFGPIGQDVARRPRHINWPTGGGNTLDARWAVLDSASTIRFACKYWLNGTEYTFTCEQNKRDWEGRSINDLLRFVIDEFAKHFAIHFAIPLLDAATKAMAR